MVSGVVASSRCCSIFCSVVGGGIGAIAVGLSWLMAVRATSSPAIASCKETAAIDGGGAMLDGERELVSVTTQVEIGVAPGVEFGRAAERLAAAHFRAAFACVMHEQDGDVVLALELAEVRKEWGAFAGCVLVVIETATSGRIALRAVGRLHIE